MYFGVIPHSYYYGIVTILSRYYHYIGRKYDEGLSKHRRRGGRGCGCWGGRVSLSGWVVVGLLSVFVQVLRYEAGYGAAFDVVEVVDRDAEAVGDPLRLLVAEEEGGEHLAVAGRLQAGQTIADVHHDGGHLRRAGVEQSAVFYIGYRDLAGGIYHATRIIAEESVAHHREPGGEGLRRVVVAQPRPAVGAEVQVELLYEVVGRDGSTARRRVGRGRLQRVEPQQPPEPAIQQAGDGLLVARRQVGHKLAVARVWV